jgi:hypothetical protein
MLMVALELRYQDCFFDYFFSKGGTLRRERNSNSSAQGADFVAVQISGRQGHSANHAAGATQLYLLIMSAVIAHSIVVCIIVAWCFKGILKRYSSSKCR